MNIKHFPVLIEGIHIDKIRKDNFYLETFTLFANNVLRWNLDVLEKDFRRIAALNAHLLLRWSAGDTAEISLDDESRDLVLRFARLGIVDGRLCENGQDIGDTTV